MHETGAAYGDWFSLTRDYISAAAGAGAAREGDASRVPLLNVCLGRETTSASARRRVTLRDVAWFERDDSVLEYMGEDEGQTCAQRQGLGERGLVANKRRKVRDGRRRDLADMLAF